MSTSPATIVREFGMDGLWPLFSRPRNNLLFSVFQAVGLVSRSGQDYYSDYSEDVSSQFSSPGSFSEKASELFQEMGKAVHRDPSPYSSVNRYNRVPKQF